jgi:hypothetical protein
MLGDFAFRRWGYTDTTLYAELLVRPVAGISYRESGQFMANALARRAATT